MRFDTDFYTMREQYEKYLAYENDVDTYDVLIFVNTPSDIGFLPTSDVICVFDDKTRALIAVIERIAKKELPLLKRLTLGWHNHRIKQNTPLGFECYIQRRGDYYEYQFYRRWWYDLNVQLGAIDLSKHVRSDGQSGEDKSDIGDV